MLVKEVDRLVFLMEEIAILKTRIIVAGNPKLNANSRIMLWECPRYIPYSDK